MKLNKDTVLSTVLGVILAAACNGRLIVADGARHLTSEDGGVVTGGAPSTGGASAGGANAGGGSSIPESGGNGNAGGTAVGGSGPGGSHPGGAGGVEQGGAGGEVIIGTGGMPAPPPTCSPLGAVAGFYGAGGEYHGTGPTCTVDANGIAPTDFATLCTGYRCAASSAALLQGLSCTELTTDHAGFTKTVGCGVETVEFNAEGGKELYAATFDVSTQKLTTLEVREDHTTCFGACPCTAMGFQAGPAPSACPTAVTYRCQHVTLTGSDEHAYAGCRDPGDAQCAECCEGTQNPDNCTLWSSSLSSVYDVQRWSPALCPCGCAPCATCKLDDERQARIAPERADCDCSKVVIPGTGAGGSDPGGDPCIPYCSYRDTLLAHCPGF